MQNKHHNNIIIDPQVKIGKNVIIEPNNIIKGNCIIGDNTHISFGNYIENSIIGKYNYIEFSHITNSVIKDNTTIGPYSRIRPGSVIGNNCKIGNFVEIKNSIIKDYTKASHLTYIGDTEIGENCNIGCGVIFANYNGKTKNKSIVENNCFIGSNVNIISPVRISQGTYICAGTTITNSTNPDDFVIGRPIPTTKPHRAKLYRK